MFLIIPSIEFPSLKYCTDNAAMIAMAAHLKMKNNTIDEQNLYPQPRLNF